MAQSKPDYSTHPIAKRLRRELAGDVRFDPMTRTLFSTDASNYQIMPIGVVFPRHAEDIRRLVEITADHSLALLPRGGGTSLAGQTVGEAIVIDFSKYMHQVLEVNTDERWARIQPGVVLDNFNSVLKPNGLMFGPEVSPSSQATLGGMIGNNSCGSRSIEYGKMVDHVMELSGTLANGETFNFGTLSKSDLAQHLEKEDAVSRIVQAVNTIARAHETEVDRRFPKLLRRVAGYNLDECGIRDQFNLAGLLVGSEGTLAIHTEARVRLVPRPVHTVLGICHFDTFAASMAASAPIVELKPQAIELTDKLLLDLANESPLYRDKLHFVSKQPQALLMVEFAGDTREAILRKLDELAVLMRDLGYGENVVRVVEPARQADVWAVRKAGLGLLGSLKGDAKPLAFVEDTAVAPEDLPAFTAAFHEILDQHEVRAAFYGHASVGCLHIRPILDLRKAKDIEKYRAIAEEVTDLALKFGGTHSGEHGEGLARSEFNPKVFGATLYAAFQEVKAVFDPNNRMNPGKKVNAPPMDHNLRYGADYRVTVPVTVLDHSEFGGVDKAIEMCNGNGRCRKSEVGTMCPSYMATLDEMHSTRGRANALHAAMSGRLPEEALFSDEMHGVMDLCLSCKACKFECPSHVDMAKHKYEFLVGYYKRHGVPLRSRLLGHLHTLSAIGSFLAPVSNIPARITPLRRTLNYFLGLHPDRSLPLFRRDTFWRWWQRHASQSRPQDERRPIVLLADTFSNFYEPEIAIAATRVLEAGGYQVIVPKPVCCGRPLLSEGLHEEALARTRDTVAQLMPYIELGYPIVGLEPSCLLTMRDDYPPLLQSQDARTVSTKVLLIEEFLAQETTAGRLSLPLAPLAQRALLHGHCHQKSIATTAGTHATLKLIPDLEVTEIDSGCCGMAGSFGYEAEHYDLSMTIADRVLLPAVRAASEDTLLVANGASCRHQIMDGASRQVRHTIQVLADALTNTDGK